ncbi:Uncharacterized protein Nst1_159 [Candidatus Nanobsidianus stetteri]|uniref:Uncharacterized protein n=1 Tax=Nanobsidianus stetteri TaxID=1294122 RepID=R1FUP8_NANST|nr:Uncharacterized protein Nst1_159 [Candidatus Nanobsidianus stetteri]
MRDEKIQSQTLDEMLIELVSETAKYSFTLGDWGEYIWIIMDLKGKGHNAESVGAKLSEIRRGFDVRYIYHREYDYNTNTYSTIFGNYIRELNKNIEKVADITINIETRAIDIYKRVVNSYLDPSRKYAKILIYFKRKIDDYNKIIEEIDESIIFGQSISNKYGFVYQPAFKFMTLREKEKDKNENITELSKPDYYEFSYTVYELSEFSLNSL